MSPQWEPVIGLEIHAELLTRSKMFCSCAVIDDYAAAQPNTHVCPVCMALPGSLPVINARAVEFTVKAGLALGCTIGEFSLFARKNYFYPDLPKGYQISQYEYPLCRDGWLEVETGDARGAKRTPALRAGARVGITRVHLEEDTGKLTHMGDASLVDLNRAGVPLMEIVSEPDMRSVDEVKAYAIKIRAILRYIGVNSGDMEKGALRFEANISIRPAGSSVLNTRTEIKNLNSFRALVRATEYEIARQIRLVESGGQVEQETLGWDEARGETYSQRSKEHAHDYRYFPEPDLPPLEISREQVERIRATLPELPDAKLERFMTQYGLSEYDAGLLVAERAVADFFEACAARLSGVHPQTYGFKAIANWMTGELFRLMNQAGLDIQQVQVKPADLVALVEMVSAGRVNQNTAKFVFEEMFATGEPPATIVERKGWAQISDAGELASIVERVLDENPKQTREYLSGKEQIGKWLLGQVMRATRGQANPQAAQDALRAAVDKRR
jgi:aspartyl-tRNA(Asn)/glutamyl-tRNA(Gln) amidotransferase subunit B